MGVVMAKLDRRNVLKGAGALAATGLVGEHYDAGAVFAPAIAQGSVLTVSTWGGITEDGIKKHAQPEFERRTGAKLAFDIGGQGARFNKLLAQRVNPPADVFFSADEAVVAGRRAGVLDDVSRKSIPNLADVVRPVMTVKTDAASDSVPGVPYALFAYVLGYNPEAVKAPVTSWSDLWRPEFAGKIALAAPVHSLMPLLVIIAAELNGGSAQNIDPGFKKLAELRPAKLTVFWTDWAPLNKSGDVTIATEFDYYLESMKVQKYPIASVIPKEKGIGTAQYITYVKGSKQKALAEAFMDVMLDPKVQEAFARGIYQGPTNSKVQLPADLVAKCSCGARVEQLRFFDPELSATVRPAWTERLNIEVAPNWRAR
jgi:putative spermidine/putrescine transport system substrate-binding protein